MCRIELRMFELYFFNVLSFIRQSSCFCRCASQPQCTPLIILYTLDNMFFFNLYCKTSSTYEAESTALNSKQLLLNYVGV